MLCAALRGAGHEATVSARTGLLLDPYFSAHQDRLAARSCRRRAREAAQAGELAFGTIDSFLIWRLTGGKVHATDATNASRTLLFDIHSGRWDDELAQMLRRAAGAAAAGLRLHRRLRHDRYSSAAAIAIRGVAGDQQAATIGQGCFTPGMMKSTYGTGCFALLNTGERPVMSRNRLLTTIAWQIGGKRTYALEGSIFVAGAAVQWLRDGLKLIEKSSDTDALAASSDPAEPIYLVPAFVGLGAPYWDAQARGAIYGLTRNTGAADFARAALEAVGYQTRDLVEAMRADWPDAADTVLRVDGGMTASDIAMQFLADILNAPVDRPKVMETTALGRGLSRRPCRRTLPGLRWLCRAWRWNGVSSRGWSRRARAQMGRLARRRAAHVTPPDRTMAIAAAQTARVVQILAVGFSTLQRANALIMPFKSDGIA